MSEEVVGHVFGYGSLVATPDTRFASLSGFRRVWGVAMDNRVAIPGYKVYELPSGERPAACVAFLDLVAVPEDAGRPVNGALLGVTASVLSALDVRERQYERLEVTPSVSPLPPDDLPIWTYVGRPAGRARILTDPPILIQRSYALLVQTTFAALGPRALADYLASTEPPPFPVADLTRIDLPL
jgi:Gamma-glutamyl cyclotransferase, AIG2-like